MKRIRQLLVVLLSLVLALPALAAMPRGSSQMPCLHMQAMSYAVEKTPTAGMSDQAGPQQEKQTQSGDHCSMAQYCAMCSVSAMGADAGIPHPPLYGGQRLVTFPPSLYLFHVPDGAWRPPRFL